jgi:hypothetical protein
MLPVGRSQCDGPIVILRRESGGIRGDNEIDRRRAGNRVAAGCKRAEPLAALESIRRDDERNVSGVPPVLFFLMCGRARGNVQVADNAHTRCLECMLQSSSHSAKLRPWVALLDLRCCRRACAASRAC